MKKERIDSIPNLPPPEKLPDGYDGLMLTPDSLKRVMENTYAPDPKVEEAFKDFSFD